MMDELYTVECNHKVYILISGVVLVTHRVFLTEFCWKVSGSFILSLLKSLRTEYCLFDGIPFGVYTLGSESVRGGKRGVSVRVLVQWRWCTLV